MTRPGRVAVAGAIWLALFSALFSAGSVLNVWPPAATGRFANVDLYTGFAVGAVLLGVLARGQKPKVVR